MRYLLAFLLFTGIARADGVTEVPGPNGDPMLVFTDGPDFIAWTQPTTYPGFTGSLITICEGFLTGPLSGWDSCDLDAFQMVYQIPDNEYLTSILTGTWAEIIGPNDLSTLNSQATVLVTPEPSTVYLVGFCALVLLLKKRLW
jgi:hypothetical protein